MHRCENKTNSARYILFGINHNPMKRKNEQLLETHVASLGLSPDMEKVSRYDVFHACLPRDPVAKVLSGKRLRTDAKNNATRDDRGLLI